MVKDHRTNYETSNVNKVMDGDIDEFIESYLKATKIYLCFVDFLFSKWIFNSKFIVTACLMLKYLITSLELRITTLNISCTIE